MSFSLQNKRVLITGATDGLGLAIARELIRHNAHLIIHGRTQEKTEKTADELKKLGAEDVETIVCDLADTQSVEPTFTKLQHLDVLINNAGVWTQGNTIDTPLEKISELTKVNMLAPVLLTRLLLPILLKSEFGQILNVVSKDGVDIPNGYFDTTYVATKYAIRGFTEGLVKEFYNRNLRVMGYYPGGMETNIFKKAGDTVKQHEPWMFDPSESAEAIAFMLTRNKKVNLKRMDLINQLEQ